MKKAGIPQSIVGEDLTTQEVLGVIEAMKSLNIIRQTIKDQKKKIKEGKISVEDFNKRIKDLKQVEQDMEENIELQIEEYTRCNQLLEEYNKRT